MIVTWEAVTAMLGLFTILTAGLGFFVRATVRGEMEKLRIEIMQIMTQHASHATQIQLLNQRIEDLSGWMEDVATRRMEDFEKRLRVIENTCVAQHGFKP